MGKVQSYSRSMGEISMVNNINGKETKQKIDWDGNIENLGDNKANLKFHTDWNGDENDLTLKNTPLTTISQNKKFQQFVQKLTKARSPMPIVRAKSRNYKLRKPRRSRGRRRPVYSTRRSF